MKNDSLARPNLYKCDYTTFMIGVEEGSSATSGDDEMVKVKGHISG
jgi:hypothetical protein